MGSVDDRVEASVRRYSVRFSQERKQQWRRWTLLVEFADCPLVDHTWSVPPMARLYGDAADWG